MSGPREPSLTSATTQEAERRAIARATAVLNSESESFSVLAHEAGYDPRVDLKYSNWSDIDFRGERMHGFDFTGCRLHNCSFAGASIAGARFDGAKIDRVKDERARIATARASGSVYVPPKYLRAASDWLAYRDEWLRLPAPPIADDHLAPGDIFQDAPFAPELVVLPPGRFTMGSPMSEPGRSADEHQHEVTIGYRLAVGRYAVTFDEWDYAHKRGWVITRPDDNGWGRGRRPVINVSWDDAVAYAEALSRETGQDYRLLSESEWEYACRAGSQFAFSWGSNAIAPEQANYHGAHVYVGGGAKGAIRRRTVPVDEPTFVPNTFGLWQMHGNVFEWCADAYEADYNKVPVDGSAHDAEGDNVSRVLRGGSWFDPPQILRSAIRVRNHPVDRGSIIGFRLARTLNP